MDVFANFTIMLSVAVAIICLVLGVATTGNVRAICIGSTLITYIIVNTMGCLYSYSEKSKHVVRSIIRVLTVIGAVLFFIGIFCGVSTMSLKTGEWFCGNKWYGLIWVWPLLSLGYWGIPRLIEKMWKLIEYVAGEEMPLAAWLLYEDEDEREEETPKQKEFEMMDTALMRNL